MTKKKVIDLFYSCGRVACMKVKIKVRKTWGEMNPCTRRIDSRKVYCRRAKFQKSVDVE
jgi:hypothetical protein